MATDVELGTDLRVGQAVPGKPRDLRLLTGEHAVRLLPSFTCGLARGGQFSPRTLGEGLRPDPAEDVVRRPQLLAGVDPARLATQPLAVHEPGTGEIDDDAGPLQARDGFPVEGVGGLAVAQHRLCP